ncbi:hypothetical protein PFISCL1PPCAC_1675, partial [Pristionchus fissidentatus]
TDLNPMRSVCPIEDCVKVSFGNTGIFECPKDFHLKIEFREESFSYLKCNRDNGNWETESDDGIEDSFENNTNI